MKMFINKIILFDMSIEMLQIIIISCYKKIINIKVQFLVFWSACLTTDHEVAGSIRGTNTNFKCGLGLERGPPSLVRTIG